MIERVYAFDPGTTTGFASIDVAEDGKSFVLVRCEEIPWTDRLSDLRNLFSDVPAHIHIVVESFRLFPHKARAQIGSQFPSVRMIGAIEATVHMYGLKVDNIVFQEPGDIARVKVLEEHVTVVAGSPHKIDAYRHARLYFLKHFLINPFSV